MGTWMLMKTAALQCVGSEPKKDYVTENGLDFSSRYPESGIALQCEGLCHGSERVLVTVMSTYGQHVFGIAITVSEHISRWQIVAQQCFPLGGNIPPCGRLTTLRR